jgi:hypothetical protein
MSFKFDEDDFEKTFLSKYKNKDDISLYLYMFAEEYLSKKTIIHNKNVIKYYYGKTENAIKVFEKSWKLDYYKDCLSKGSKVAYIELGAITLYKVFYSRFVIEDD